MVEVANTAEVGEEAVLAAGALVPPGAKIPPRVLVLGAPARARRELSAEKLVYNRETNANYVRLAALHRSSDGT